MDKIFLVGPPGIGKTEIIRQLAEEEAKSLGRVFVDLREASDEVIQQILREPERYYVFIRVIAPHVFPEDLAIPRHDYEKKLVEMIPLKYWRVLSLPGIAGVLFLDELTNVHREDQVSMFFSIVLEKEASYGIRLSRQVKIIAAGNNPEWSEVARPLPKPMRAGRLTKIEVLPPTIDEWIDYMMKRYGDAWDKRIGAVLKAMQEMFLMKPDETDEFEAIPTPRSWTKLAIDLYELSRNGASKEFIEEAVYGTVGKKAGSVVLSILESNIDVERTANDLSRNPSGWAGLNVTAKILVAYYIANRDLEEIGRRFGKLIDYLVERDTEWAILTILMMPRQKRIEWLKRNADKLQRLASILSKYN